MGQVVNGEPIESGCHQSPLCVQTAPRSSSPLRRAHPSVASVDPRRAGGGVNYAIQQSGPETVNGMPDLTPLSLPSPKCSALLLKHPDIELAADCNGHKLGDQSQCRNVFS